MDANVHELATCGSPLACIILEAPVTLKMSNRDGFLGTERLALITEIKIMALKIEGSALMPANSMAITKGEWRLSLPPLA